MSNQASGRATIKLDGTPLRSKPGASIQVGGINRTVDMTDQGEPYFTEKYVAAQIKCTMPHMADADLPALRNFKNGTASWSDDIGKVYTVTKACVTEVGELSNGEVDITIAGAVAE